MPGGYWEKEFEDKGLASDLFTLLGGGLSTISQENQKRRKEQREYAIDEAGLDLKRAEFEQDEDHFTRKLASEERVAALRHRDDELVLWDPETGMEVSPAQSAPTTSPVAGMPAAGSPECVGPT
jgi:hypothetical protein